MPCCPVLLSLYCIVIVSLNDINGDGDTIVNVGGEHLIDSPLRVYFLFLLSCRPILLFYAWAAEQGGTGGTCTPHLFWKGGTRGTLCESLCVSRCAVNGFVPF